jgi:hypothetical protein
MHDFSWTRAVATAAATLSTLACAAASAQAAPPSGLGGQLFSTGGEITVKVLPATAGLTSELGSTPPTAAPR